MITYHHILPNSFHGSGRPRIDFFGKTRLKQRVDKLVLFIFVLIANITCMGVLSGLLVQTVKTVAECEKEEKEVKVRLFMLEEEPGFKDIGTRLKFNVIAKRSSDKIQEWYYELGLEEKLPKRYDHFRKMFIEKYR